MSQKTHFFVGAPEAHHWSKLLELDVLAGRVWLSLALVGENATSVGKELEQTFLDAKVTTAEDLYHLLLKLQHIALDNQVRLSLGAALLSLKRWVFFSYNALLGLRRVEKPFRWVISQRRNELEARSGKQVLGDVVVIISAELAAEAETVAKVMANRTYDDFTTHFDQLMNQKPRLVSASLALVDASGLLRSAVKHQDLKSPLNPVSRSHRAVTVKSQRQLVANSLPAKSLALSLSAATNLSRRFKSYWQQLSTNITQRLKAKPTLVQSSDQELESTNDDVLELNQSLWDRLGTKWSGCWSLLATRVSRLHSRLVAAVVTWPLPRLAWFRQGPQASAKPRSTIRKIDLSDDTATPHQKPGIRKLSSFHLGRQRRRLVSMILVGLVILLAVGVAISWRVKLHQRQLVIETKLVSYDQRLQTLKHQDETNLIQTRQAGKQLVQELEALKSQYPANSVEARAVAHQLEQTTTWLSTIAGKKEVEALPVYLDLSQFAADFVISSGFFAKQRLWLLDRSKKALIIYDSVNHQTYQQALVSLNDVRDITAYGEQALLLDDGVFTLDPSPTANPQNLIAASELVSSATLIASFDQYVYLYSPKKANIFRFGPDFNQAPRPWLKVILGGKYNQVISWAIDGGIWLSTKTGMVNYYKAGRKTDFQIKGLNSSLSGPVYLTTHADLDRLYILEPSNNRVIELDKQGNFIKEVKNYVLGSATGLVYDDSTNQVLAISGSVVYQVPLE